MMGQSNQADQASAGVKLTAAAVRTRKGREKLVMVTAYDAQQARLGAAAGADILLVGDSAAMVVLGYDTTTAISLEAIELFTGAVARGAGPALVVADLPFASYDSDAQAYASANRLLAAGADAVKLEGAPARALALTRHGIAVMGHTGLLPQSAAGDYRVRGQSEVEAQQILDQALDLEAAGCFAVVLEAVPAFVAARVTERLGVPTIGIGAGSGTDGQVLVWHDLLGLLDSKAHRPRFVKHYAELDSVAFEALTRYAQEVRAGTFPDAAHSYGMDAEEQARFGAS
jgi:3-methyl-2-oxobutanoate hydroxymethyltransferase